jgi:hypothetical protein
MITAEKESQGPYGMVKIAILCFFRKGKLHGRSCRAVY